MNTPYYIIDENKLLVNLKKIEQIRNLSGAKVLLALKCFSTWAVFGLIRKYLDGTTSSSPYEVKLGYQKFGGETHAYSVGYSDEDIKEVYKYADKIIFNSPSQLHRYLALSKTPKSLGLRINPGVSHSHYDLANPTRIHSRLGAIYHKDILECMESIEGVMFHFNCENTDFNSFKDNLSHITETYGDVLKNMSWVSLGGGIAYTAPGYPLKVFCRLLKAFSKKFGVQVYLEPGEAVITKCAELVTSVVDLTYNNRDIAIVDASVEAHMLDHLIYRTSPKISHKSGKHDYVIAGRSCLAGDIFEYYTFNKPLKIGDEIRFQDAAGYSMVKMNWFNGLRMPSIVVKRLSGKIEIIRTFDYEDFKNNLS